MMICQRPEEWKRSLEKIVSDCGCDSDTTMRFVGMEKHKIEKTASQDNILFDKHTFCAYMMQHWVDNPHSLCCM